ncbi:DegT/DnrJ/EryC1/StrS family aminotransferase [Novosphingobium mangrovi (ex Huang et al. 2023)]|uniref:DegT/DnrJ/EryC1/StrS family aminotransferase n=1 Tax=Novosphingobium mangrovi (ex Huang et al. 2023) TaxID=2976432 RepID=A0ABT2I690_9SPHN|nr:DegT/DnrJ/EryC1/StrS family aminotransferase [Novosphingobium mangrovi (ex Huang et al. 2023)]MCT2400326.1 DegT/DnrJ/EryC1/StrS family aminotransferase [Novosphingobium mangrovi (ex Huang et al. 2023)]
MSAEVVSIANGEPLQIPLCDPDLTQGDLDAVSAVLCGDRLGEGPMAERLEREFAAHCGRAKGIAVSSAALGLLIALTAKGIGAGDEVILSAHGFRELGHAVLRTGATPVFADIDYWSGCLSAGKAADKVTERTRAIIAGNTSGHPADWPALRELADAHGLFLIEDSSEAIASRHKAGIVGSFGDVALFDFAQPGVICCGEGGMIVTDDATLAMTMRRLRARSLSDRASVSAGVDAPFGAALGEVTAALALSQLSRLDVLLERRRGVQAMYDGFMQSFEGIKPPYISPDVEEVHWFLYVVHLGTRFSKSSRDAILDDMHTEGVDAHAYSSPLHLQRAYRERGWKKGDLFVTEKVADRAIAMPFHAHLTPEQVAFMVARLKDASINSGAGAAIY